MQVDEGYLERHRVVAYTNADPAHVTFDMLRTKLVRLLDQNGWHSLAITSPTAGCGKTMVAVNLALSISRQTNLRAVLIDLDLRRPAVAQTLGVRAQRSIGEYIEGRADLEDCFIRIGDNLYVGLNTHAVPNSSDMMQRDVVQRIVPTVLKALDPHVVLIDLPPVLSANDAVAFLPQVESCVLVVGGGQTTPHDIEESERQLGDASNFLGVILNKAESWAEPSYPYEPYS